MGITKLIVSAIVGVLLITCALLPIIDANDSDGQNTLDVVVIDGQSNAAYVSNYMDLNEVNENIPQISESCYYYGYNTPNLVRPTSNLGELDHLSQIGIYSMSKNGSWIIGGEEVSLATTIAQYTHDDVLVINVAIPGNPITFYESTSQGGIYAKTLIADALSKIPSGYDTVNLVGWMWCQGESDKTTVVGEYVSSFTNIKGYFEELGFKNCYLVQTKPSDSGNATLAQAQICNTIPNVVLASTAPAGFTVANGGLIEGNTLHYTQEGRNIVGKQVGEAANQALPIHMRDSPATYMMISLIPFMILTGLVIMIAKSALSEKD